MHGLSNTAYQMADIRDKRSTRRRAVAMGELIAGTSAYPLIVDRRLPKGDALALAEVAGIQGAKLASSLLPLCHPLTLDFVQVRCEPVPERQSIRVYCEVASDARTGVEMEALAGASSALLTLYDLTKPVEPALRIEQIRLLFKEGGKKGLWRHPQGMSETEELRFRPRTTARLDGVSCAVLTLSDRASAGVYEDRAGPVLVEALRQLGAQVEVAEVLADGVEPLATRLRTLADQGVRLALCTGGTGLGPRDDTPEALRSLGGREVPGLAEVFRAEGAKCAPMAWLSRAVAVQFQGLLVIALPGNPRAVAQGMEILSPLLAHALAMIAGAGHG